MVLLFTSKSRAAKFIVVGKVIIALLTEVESAH
jgi:hypothetical protein